eukprot:scaffold313364_cov13-Tisochrysis_lutea.AAC.1
MTKTWRTTSWTRTTKGCCPQHPCNPPSPSSQPKHARALLKAAAMQALGWEAARKQGRSACKGTWAAKAPKR